MKQMPMTIKPQKKQLRERKFHVGFFMKIRLIIQGRIGARKAIERQNDCPFMAGENAKVKMFCYDMLLEGLKKIQKEKIMLDNYCALYDSQSSDIEKLLTELEHTVGVHETVTIATGLPDRVNELLNVKRKSEDKLDEIALRLRRFREYSDLLKPLRHELKLLKDDIRETYNMVVVYNSYLEIVDNQAREISRKFCEYTNLRISLYWYGVFLKVRDTKSLSSHDIDMAEIDKIIEENRKFRDKKIEELFDRHDALMKRMDCLSIK